MWARLNFVDRLYVIWFSAATLLVIIRHSRLPQWPWFLGLHAAAIAIILWLARGQKIRGVRHFFHHWYTLPLAIVSFLETAHFSRLIVPDWRDPVLIALERRLFSVPPTVWLQQFTHPLVTELLQLGYFSYFTYQMLVGGVLYARADKQPFRQLMTVVALAYSLCTIAYVLFPTESPARTLRAQHTAEFHGGMFHFFVGLIQRYFGVHGNAFPSSHIAAASSIVVIAWKYARPLAYGLTPLLVLMCIGAVYDRYHYFSDVVSGLALGCVVALFVIRQWRRIATPRDLQG